MKRCSQTFKLVSAMLLINASLLTSNVSAQTDSCQYDEAEALALEPWDFEQDPDKGWRQFEGVEACAKVAADLIRTYSQSRELPDDAVSFFSWHEGQLRAEIGQEEEALRLFKQADNKGEDITGWNYYVAATIAFFEEDMAALQANREKLAAVPAPEGFQATDRDGNPVDDAWPMHLNDVDNLIECFGEDYIDAHEGCNLE